MTDWKAAKQAAAEAMFYGPTRDFWKNHPLPEREALEIEKRHYELQAALDALEAAGYGITKLEPDDAMAKAGSQEWGLVWSTDDDGMNGCLDYDGCRKVYTAMIKAAQADME
jgi:streptogramin lyase